MNGLADNDLDKLLREGNTVTAIAVFAALAEPKGVLDAGGARAEATPDLVLKVIADRVKGIQEAVAQRYTSGLVGQGFDTVDMLQHDLLTEDLDTFDIKPVHKRCLRQVLKNEGHVNFQAISNTLQPNNTPPLIW